MPSLHNPACFAAHMGMWLADPSFVRQAHAAILSGAWQPTPEKSGGKPFAVLAGVPVFDPQSDPDYPVVAYTRTNDGIAVIEVCGAMAKAAGKYARCGTVDVRRYMRIAEADPEVSAIMLSIDSPGGTVAGTQALGDDVRAIDQRMPVYAHIEDLGASAAYWTASQARRITANRSAMVGSLGTYAVLYDTSEQAKAEGVKVHVISTGPHKGAGVDGAPITPVQLDEMQRTVNDMNAMFVQAVSSGRRKSMEETAALFDGRVHIAARALELGLIDGIASFDQALADVSMSILSSQRREQNARRLQIAQRR